MLMLVFFLFTLLKLHLGITIINTIKERPLCRPGFYCPPDSLSLIPCPAGTYSPTAGAETIETCLRCPPLHYCPRPGLSAPLPCGPGAQQPLDGQEKCNCPNEGQIFQQPSDGRCICTIGYHPTTAGDLCVQELYDVCRDGKSRTQHGACLDKKEWSLHCSHQVCQKAEDYRGYDGELGLCICKDPPSRAACGSLCRRKPAAHFKLQCNSKGERELLWSSNAKEKHILFIPEGELETAFNQWDAHSHLQCISHRNISHPVYFVKATEKGFVGILDDFPQELEQFFLKDIQWKFEGSTEEDYKKSQEIQFTNFSQIGSELNSIRWKEDWNYNKKEQDLSMRTGVLNPTACLHLRDILLFLVNTRHYPQYDINNLYQTNSDFDWGAFRLLEEELTLSWNPPTLFPVMFDQPGVYVFTLSSNQHKHMYVKVMPAGGQCYEPGSFFPTIPRHVTKLGISKRRDLLLKPDWLVTWGLLFGAAVILCMCITVLILFREYGWPEKEPFEARYRVSQLAYQMDDYSSKGSRVISFRKTHRKQQARMTQDSIQPECTGALEEFWDYEQQVDLEAFNSNTFYSLLLKQSLSVTSRLGQLTTEVKELYQGVLGKLQPLCPRLVAEDRVGERSDKMRREVEREIIRRKSVGSQLRTLLDNQLQVLMRELQAKHRVYSLFMSQLRECSRLLPKIHSISPHTCGQQQQMLIQRLSALVEDMTELASAECHRQGAWGFLGEGTGAKPLCPNSGGVLTKDQIFRPDGSLQAYKAFFYDQVTGLIRPNSGSHMLLSSGHTMAVPPDFFLHPQTGRIMPILGNVAYDPTGSTLVVTTDTCRGEIRKWDNPLLPFIPYPNSCHSDQPLSTTPLLKPLQQGQHLHLGISMPDPDTGVPVPVLAVTIHPQTGLVYPLGRLHICPLTRMKQPIQIGYPMLDSRTGNVVLTAGVSLDPVTGDVHPLGGVTLAESFNEPLSGRMVRTGGAIMRAGQVVPSAGGYQTLLDNKVLVEMFKVLDLFKLPTADWGSYPNFEPFSCREKTNGQQDSLVAATKELEDAWGRSLHCQLQLQTRLEMLLECAVGLQKNGGTLGEICLPGSDTSVPALLGMDYPDPLGSGLSVPVLGCQTDPFSGNTTPLVGTMEDPGGKGLVAIRYGSQTVDPVSGVVAPVVGIRLDVFKKTTVPVTASYWLMMAEQTDSIQVEVLQREISARKTFWQQLKNREEEIFLDLDAALFQCLYGISEFQWTGQQLREAAAELQDVVQNEAQRRAAHRSHLALVLPLHVLNILASGDEEEQDQQCAWHSALLSFLDKTDICLEQLQQDMEKWMTQAGEESTKLQAVDRELRHRELMELCASRQSELETALSLLRFVRHLSQLWADTAQAVLCGNFWFKDYGLVRCRQPEPSMKLLSLLQQRALPLLGKMNQFLEEKQPIGFPLNTCSQHISGSNAAPDSESQEMKGSVQSTQLAIPMYSEEQWTKLLKVSPLFQQLKVVDIQLRHWSKKAGPFEVETLEGKGFLDVLDAQWECEGELIPQDLATLNPREFLTYQHGLFLMNMLHKLNLTPVISLQIASSLPQNNYLNNAFRNSFFYQQAEETLFVRRQRLQSVGGFSLILLHCLAHIKTKDMSSDANPAFQRLFYRTLQESLGELFTARLAMPFAEQDVSTSVWFQEQKDLMEAFPDCSTASLLLKLHKPSRGLLSEDEVEKLQKKYTETSVIAHLEGLLVGRSPETTKSGRESTA